MTYDQLFPRLIAVNSLFHAGHPDTLLPHVRSLLAPTGTLVVIEVVVDPPRRGGAHTRAWHCWRGITDAVRTLRRHRSPREALDVLRLRWHPARLSHVRTNIPLSGTQFHSAYTAAFPGASYCYNLDPFLAALTWQATERQEP